MMRMKTVVAAEPKCYKCWHKKALLTARKVASAFEAAFLVLSIPVECS